jgi:hypothetical protein
VTDLTALFDHEDLEGAPRLARELTEPNCPGQTGRAGADEKNVYFEPVAFGHSA